MKTPLNVEEGFAEDLLKSIDDRIQLVKELLTNGQWETLHEAREHVGEIRGLSIVRENLQRLLIVYFNLRLK